MYSPEIHLMSHDLSLFLEGGGLRKTTLSLFKDVTLRLGGGGVKGKSDNVTLYSFFFFDGVPYRINLFISIIS